MYKTSRLILIAEHQALNLNITHQGGIKTKDSTETGHRGGCAKTRFTAHRQTSTNLFKKELNRCVT